MIRCNELPRYQYCDMYHIAESFAFYTFIYDTCFKFLISFPEPSYAKKKKKKRDCYFLRDDKTNIKVLFIFCLFSMSFLKVMFDATPVHW